MGRQKEDLYRNLSRKDLQVLCKKYGLPANKSNSEMATSLILYLEKKNLSSRPICEGSGSDPPPSGTTELQAGTRINSVGDRRKDFKGKMSHSGQGNSHCHNHVVQQDELLNCQDPSASDKASKDVGSSKVRRHSHSGAGLPKSPVQAPSPDFQYDMSSEDGIQLQVDLNSNTLDWIESLKDGVRICQDMSRPESSSFAQLGWLQHCSMQKDSLIDSYETMGNGEVEEGSYPITTNIGVSKQSSEPDGAERSLSSPEPNIVATARTVDNLEGDEATTSSRNKSDVEKQVSGANVCLGSEGTPSADRETNIVTQIGTCDNDSGKSYSSSPKGSKILENQDISVRTDIYKEPSLGQTLGQPAPVLICKESPILSAELQASRGNNTSCQDKTGMLLDIANQPQSVETEHCGLINSIQLQENVSQTQPNKTDDQTEPASCSAGMDGSSLCPTDLKQYPVEAKHDKTSTVSEFSCQVTEAPNHLANSPQKNTTLSPSLSCEPQGVVSLTNSTKRENGSLICPNGTSQEAFQMHSSLVIVQGIEASFSSCGNGGSVDLVVPKQNGPGHRTPEESSDLVEGVHNNDPTSLENLGRAGSVDERKTSECLDFRESMEETSRKSANSENIHEPKRKRQLTGAEDHRPPANTKILRSSKQFVGDVHANRRRSSRLFTK